MIFDFYQITSANFYCAQGQIENVPNFFLTNSIIYDCSYLDQKNKSSQILLTKKKRKI